MKKKPVGDHNSELPTAPMSRPPAYLLRKLPCRMGQPGSEKSRQEACLSPALVKLRHLSYGAGGAAALVLWVLCLGAGAVRDCPCTAVSSTTVPSSSCPPHRLPSLTK